jgi:hypothetical protein
VVDLKQVIDCGDNYPSLTVEMTEDRCYIILDKMVEFSGTIIMPELHSEQSRKATVMAVGPEVNEYAVGDRVIVPYIIGHKLHLVEHGIGTGKEETRHRIVRQGEILFKVH